MKFNFEYYYHLFGMPALWFHELSHLIVAKALSVNVVGVSIRFYHKEGHQKSGGFITTNGTEKWELFLICMAPTLFWVAALVLCDLFSPIHIYLAIFWHKFNCSNGDLKQLKAILSGKTLDQIAEITSDIDDKLNSDSTHP